MATDNPLREGLDVESTPAPCAFVIFGASGDLTRRKLIPALYNLFQSRLLPQGTAIVGFANSPLSSDQFRGNLRQSVQQFSRRRSGDERPWAEFERRIHYIQGHFEDPASFDTLARQLQELDETQGTRHNRIFYLAVPPSAFSTVNHQLARAGLISEANDGSRYTRIIVEKPFGRDLASGSLLNSELHRVFDERQIFRIDHYLGKETVQNLLAFRFGNEFFEPIWNRNHIDHVQITVAEDMGVEGRGRFYEEAGATRDIIQNHLLQLLMITGMEPPVSFDADEVRNEKVKVLRALRPYQGEDVAKYTVRGQYGHGNFEGSPVLGYREEIDVSPVSLVETYVAMKLSVDNWRWEGVPFYIRAGKRLTKRITEISLHFKRVPHQLLTRNGANEPGILALRIQPNEGISLRFLSKVPGPTMTLRPVTMDFLYGKAFGDNAPEAYERLLLDAMRGDATLFARSDEVISAWKFITPILEQWQSFGPPSFPNYAAGTWGPVAADRLLGQDLRHWRRL